jgi:hypothetical protein
MKSVVWEMSVASYNWNRGNVPSGIFDLWDNDEKTFSSDFRVDEMSLEEGPEFSFGEVQSIYEEVKRKIPGVSKKLTLQRLFDK